MNFKQSLVAAGLVTAIGFGVPASTFGHDTNQPYGWPHGGQAGPMMGPGMMGQGYGPGMTGHGYGPGMMGHGYGPGMMGHGYGPGMMGHGYGPGMMGQGYGPGYGPGTMGRGYGPGTMQPLREDLSVADVTHMIEHRLAWQGNPNLKLGKVEEKDEDTIIAEIVTQDGSLVDRLDVDRHTGWIRPVR